MAGMLAPLATAIIIDRTGVLYMGICHSAALAVVAVLAWGIVIPQAAGVGWPNELAGTRV